MSLIYGIYDIISLSVYIINRGTLRRKNDNDTEVILFSEFCKRVIMILYLITMTG